MIILALPFNLTQRHRMIVRFGTERIYDKYSDYQESFSFKTFPRNE